MTSPEPSPTRPLRVAGLALLGVAAVSLVIGLVSIFGGNGNGQADGGNGEQTTTTATSVPDGSQEPGSATTAPTTTNPAPTTTTGRSPTSPPGTGVATPPRGDGNGEPGKTQQVRVLNNSTVGGLAARAADDLREAGWSVVEVGNFPDGVIPTTTVYYRPGTAEQRAAELLADEFGMRVEPRFAGIDDLGPGLVVIVTGDYQGPGGDRPPIEKNDS